MKQVTIPAQWLQELIALCGPEDHELRERVMKSAATAPADSLATGGQAQAEHIKALIEVSRMPNQEHVADAHNAAVRHLRAIAAAKGD